VKKVMFFKLYLKEENEENKFTTKNSVLKYILRKENFDQFCIPIFIDTVSLY